MPPGIELALYVVRFLISYACHIAAKAEECAMQGDLGPVSIPFCKGIQIDALIIRVARGLRRALALQEMLLKRAAEGTDIQPVPPRQCSSGGGRKKQDGQDEDKQPNVERLPSVEEIAEELLHRPIGAIVADICHDVGLVPSDLTDEQWDALQFVINEYGGSLMKLWPAIRNNLVNQMEGVAKDPEHAQIPQLPLIPWTRQPGLGRRPPPDTHPP